MILTKDNYIKVLNVKLEVLEKQIKRDHIHEPEMFAQGFRSALTYALETASFLKEERVK